MREILYGLREVFFVCRGLRLGHSFGKRGKDLRGEEVPLQNEDNLLYLMTISVGMDPSSPKFGN